MTTILKINNNLENTNNPKVPKVPKIPKNTNNPKPPKKPKNIIRILPNLNPCQEQQQILEEEYKGECDMDLDSKECNQFILKKELADRICLNDQSTNDVSFLYPEFNDPNFNIKIAKKKEFQETKYDGKIHSDVKEYANRMMNAEFEIQPHQAFVRNFLSFQTPYNSLLLYHGLGSGKTYSAIGVCEEMRDYLKNLGSNKKIIIVASENVQNNFRTQMFDERKLVLVNDRWTIKGYVANQLLKEVNPMNQPGISKEKLMDQINALINRTYLFVGYGRFANYIMRVMKNVGKNEFEEKLDKNINLDDTTKRYLKNEFEGRLIVIDEIHNIRKAEDIESKKVAVYFELLVTAVRNLRLLFLSATPMFNSYKEIVWLTNIMNINDQRAKIDVKDIFEANGEFKKEGRELFIRKVTGYVSFVRGENPYTFPYRIYPSLFAPNSTFPTIPYPLYQMNGKRIRDENRERILSLYLTKIGNCNRCGVCQYCDYRYILYFLKNKNMNITTKKGKTREMRSFLDMTKFGYTLLQTPLESLIISYPNEKLREIIDQIPENQYTEELAENIVELSEIDELNNEKVEEETKGGQGQQGGEGQDEEEEEEETKTSLRQTFDFTIDPRELTGKKGLENMMNFVDKTTIPPEKGAFEYKKTTIDKYGRIFSPSLIGKYSAKIKNIVDSIHYSLSNQTTDFRVSEGVILIYSQYIDAGLIPMALALEEMGFTRYGKNVKPLFKKAPTEVVDVRTLQPPVLKNDFLPARYSMITGDIRLSPDNEFEVKGLTNDDNKDGHKVKIVLISRTGAEGIDFKYIRQIHILEPWYNMNRIEQIIGRGVRNASHKLLPFEKRNVEIFMYGTILDDNKEEAADLYVYRVAEFKAIQIGRVTRLLKETAVDCIIHHDQTNFTQEKMAEIMKKPVTQILSNGEILHNFKIGDVPFSPACDYMENCDYQCIPDATIKKSDINENTYSEAFMSINNEKINQKIKLLMKERFFYIKKDLIAFLKIPVAYPLIQIYSALTQMIEENEIITDRYGRTGYLVNIGEYYLFQPIELIDKDISIFDRSVPIDYKHQMIRFDLQENGVFKGREEEREKNADFVVKDVVNLETEKTSEKGKESEKEKEKQGVFEKLQKTFMLIQESYGKISQENIALDKKQTLKKWYSILPYSMNVLNRQFHISLENLNEYLLDHMIETSVLKEKIELLNTIYFLKRNVERNSFEWYVKNYFMKNIIHLDDVDAIVFQDIKQPRVFVLNPKIEKWVDAEPEDIRNLKNSEEGKAKFDPNFENMYSIVGFIAYDKKEQYLVFKTRDLTAKRDTGASCDQAKKPKIIQILNEVIGETRYTNENTNDIYREELCILLEFLMRHNNQIKKDGKIWFIHHF